MESAIVRRFDRPFAEESSQWIQVVNGWNTVKGVYGQIHEVTVRFRLPKKGVGAWIGANMSKDSEISLRITPRDKVATLTDQLYAHLYYRGLQVREYSDNHRPRWLTGCRIDDLLGVTWEDDFECTLRVEGCTVTVIVNGTEVLKTQTAPFISSNGYFGVHSSSDVPIDVDWMRVTYTPKPLPAPAMVAQHSVWRENFSQMQVPAESHYWMEPLNNHYWKIAQTDSGCALCTQGVAGFAPVYLHVFDRDTKLRVLFTTEGNQGGCGFLFRMGPDAMYLKLRADLERKQWQLLEARLKGGEDILLATADLSEATRQEIRISLSGSAFTLEQDGRVILHSEDRIRNMGHARPGFFTDGAPMYIHELEYTFPDGGTPNADILEYTTPEPGCCSGSMQILPIGEGKAIGFSKSGNNFMFRDYGASCERIENDPYQPINRGGEYISILKMKNGKYLKVDVSTFMASQSDDLITWEDLSYVIPPDEQIDHVGRHQFLFHVNTLRQIKLPTGEDRIFFPVLHRFYMSDYAKGSCGNYSMVFYSDDSGRTWQASRTVTTDVALDTAPPTSMWGESKVILCADGSLRLYMTRGRVGCMQYLTSRDGGVTWTEYGVIPYLQCALSSYCIEKDPDTGMYYLVWVNNTPCYYGCTFDRTRVSLARSSDGMNWEYLCDVDRFDERTAPWDITPVFQIVDPSLAIDGGYLLISYGRGENEVFPTMHSYHRAQRARVVRVPISTLKPRPWDAVSISDTRQPGEIRIAKLPERLCYHIGEQVDLTGGQVDMIAMDGTVTRQEMSKLYFRREPVLDQVGKMEIVLYNMSGLSCRYEIEVQA